MHEMSYVTRFVNLAIDTAREQKAQKVYRLVVSVGEMTGVVPAYLHRYYPEAVRGTILEDATLVIEEQPAIIRCASCGGQYHPSRETDYRCPRCKSTQGKVLDGRQVRLEEVVTNV